jgi:hypothetical protein
LLAGSSYALTSPITSAVLTINGVSYSFAGTFQTGIYTLANEIYAQVDDGFATFLDNDIYNNSDYHFPSTLSAFPTITAGVGDTGVGNFNIFGQVSGSLLTETFTLAGGASPVPGPIVGAGLPGLVTLLGWFGYGRLRRKKLAG